MKVHPLPLCFGKPRMLAFAHLLLLVAMFTAAVFTPLTAAAAQASAKPAAGTGPPAAPADSPIVDGAIDAAYGAPLASDSAGDGNGNANMDLLDLYITDDADYVYFAYTVNANLASTNWGKYLLYLDTTNDASGATFDAWGRSVSVTDPHKPEFSLNSWVDAAPYGPEDTQLWAWGGSSWSQTGSAAEAALGAGATSVIEWKAAKTALGNPSDIWVEVWDTGGGTTDNAQDTINDPADDWNATNWSTPAVLSNSTPYAMQNGSGGGGGSTLECTSGAAHDNNIWWDDLGHNSRDTLFRTPGGPVPTATVVTLRLRAACGDLTSVQARVYNDRTNTETLSPMALGLQDGLYEWWELTLPASLDPTVYWYRFIAKDGSATAYYEDDSARTGGWGHPTAATADDSWQLTHYDPTFHTPDWVKNAIVYQIFPDRFLDGDPANDTPAGSFFYAETPTIVRSNDAQGNWNTRVCDPRDAGSPCPQVYSQNFYGGDLQGVVDKLAYLQGLGVTAIYFNPLFESPSNHKYDTTDYSLIDDNLGNLALFQALVAEAHSRGIKVILDGVFNHTSSDSLYFDRYGRYGPPDGACESTSSTYRTWYYFTPAIPPGSGPCAGDTTYTSWFGFASLPKLNASNPEVTSYIWGGGPNAIARYWMQWADGWRLDVGGDVDPGTLDDPTNLYWEGFRAAIHLTNPEAYIVGEEWGNATSWVLGNEWDATTNYQYGTAMLGFWRDAPLVDNDHNAGSSAGIIEPLTPSQLNERLLNWIERYPPEALAAMMNLLDSHDTNRALFLLDHNAALGTDDSLLENPTYDWSDPITRLKGVAMLQMSLPGAPTIYYGDEVGAVGPTSYANGKWEDDPYNRVPYPWLDQTGSPFYTHMQSQASQDALRAYYTTLTTARNAHAALRTGSFDPLLIDDGNMVYAFGRKLTDHTDAAIVILNRGGSLASPLDQDVTLGLAGYLPYNATFEDIFTGQLYTIDGAGSLTVNNVPGQSGVVLVLTAPVAPAPDAVADLAITSEANGQLTLAWTAANGASSYAVYRSLVSGGGYAFLTNTLTTVFTDTGLINAVPYYYTLESIDDATGLRSNYSNEASGIPGYDLSSAWYNLQWPVEITHTISTITPTPSIYGQIYIAGATGAGGPASGITAQVGFGPPGTLPTSAGWAWAPMDYNAPAGNNDEYSGTLLPEYLGDYDYSTRWSSDGGRTWVYSDLGGPGMNGNPGLLHVVPGSDTEAPNPPLGLEVTAATAASISLAWQPNSEPDLARYEVYREVVSSTVQAPASYVRVGVTDASTTEFTDTSVTTGQTYGYYILAVDTSFNRSGPSNEVVVTAEARVVQVIFTVTAPGGTPGPVFIAGSIPGLPLWNPGATPITQTGDITWTFAIDILDGSSLEYKYTRGNWETVEKQADGNTEIPNRTATVEYGLAGVQYLDDTVANWRDPFVLAHIPAAGETQVDPSTTITLTWNQSMDPATTFAVESAAGSVPGSFAYDNGTFTVEFTPAAPLLVGTVFTVTASGATDAGGDTQQVPTVFSFSTPGGDVGITKTASASSVRVNTLFTYTITVTNPGPDIRSGLAFTDSLPAGTLFGSTTAGCAYDPPSHQVSCPAGTLAPGEAAVFTLTVTSPPVPATLTNTATLSPVENDPNPVNNTATATATITYPTADLALTMNDSADPVLLGNQFSYAITVTNLGPEAAEGVVVVDTLPSGLDYISNDAGCTENSGVVTCGLGMLASGGETGITLVVAAAEIGTHTNQAMVSGAILDPVSGNNAASEATTVAVLLADLETTMADSADPVEVGVNFTYSLTITNHGPDIATNNTLVDTLPAGLDYVSGSAGCVEAGGVVACTLVNLAHDETAIVTLVVTASADGEYTNTATATSADITDPNPANNTATETTTVTGGATVFLPAVVR